MKRYLFGLSLALATIALLGFARSAPAQVADQFKLSGTVTKVELLSKETESFTLRFTIYGEGTIGDFKQVTTANFFWVGGTVVEAGTWLFNDSTRIDVLDPEGEPTGDVIYLESFGTNPPGLGAQGSYEITGGEGSYEDASGKGSFFFRAPGASYNGAIRR
jgi:hypothetical protein